MNSPLYISFLDQETLDSMNRTVWYLLRHYEVPEELVTIMKISYKGLNCKLSIKANSQSSLSRYKHFKLFEP